MVGVRAIRREMPVMAEIVSPSRYEVHPLENSEPPNGRSSKRPNGRRRDVGEQRAAPDSEARPRHENDPARRCP